MFGDKLKQLRNSHNLTQKELGEKFNLSQRVIGYYEKNERFPDQTTLLKIAEYFDVSIDFLLGRTDYKHNHDDISKLKKDKDIEEILENTMNDILNQEGLMLNGEILNDNDLMLLKKAIKNGIEYAKSMKEKDN